MSRRAALLALALVSATAATASAQSPGTGTFLGLGVGLGGGGEVSDAGVAVVEVARQRGPHRFSVRAAGRLDPFGERADVAGELGVLYGRAVATSWGRASASAGLALTGFDACQSSQDSCFAVGVPLVGEVDYPLAPWLGLALQAFANLNAESIYGGIALVAQVGRLP